jgi:hypothetical protein
VRKRAHGRGRTLAADEPEARRQRRARLDRKHRKLRDSAAHLRGIGRADERCARRLRRVQALHGRVVDKVRAQHVGDARDVVEARVPPERHAHGARGHAVDHVDVVPARVARRVVGAHRVCAQAEERLARARIAEAPRLRASAVSADARTPATRNAQRATHPQEDAAERGDATDNRVAERAPVGAQHIECHGARRVPFAEHVERGLRALRCCVAPVHNGNRRSVRVAQRRERARKLVGQRRHVPRHALHAQRVARVLERKQRRHGRDEWRRAVLEAGDAIAHALPRLVGRERRHRAASEERPASGQPRALEYRHERAPHDQRRDAVWIAYDLVHGERQ